MAQSRQRLLESGGGGDDLGAEFGEHLLDHDGNERLVLDQQDALAGKWAHGNALTSATGMSMTQCTPSAR